MQPKLTLSNEFTMAAIDYAGQGNAILGIRDAGKTHTAMKAAEELLDAGIPIIVYDPVGVWKNLKIGIGKHRGYPIVVAGGQGSDIILTPDNAVDIVRAAIKAGISLVIDLYSRELINKSTWIKIVQETVDLLVYENEPYGMRHIFLEEAAEFIPQKLQPQHSRVYGSLERLARIGRNARLGYTLINQRAEEVNKAILEISAIMLLHKQVGKNSINSIKKWLELLQVDNVPQVIKTLSQLKPGQCWVIGHGMCQLIQVGTRKTFHPDPKRRADLAPAENKKIDVSQFVNKLNDQLNKKPETVKASPKMAKADDEQISRLNSQIDDLRKKNQEQGIIINKQAGIIAQVNKVVLSNRTIIGQFNKLLANLVSNNDSLENSENSPAVNYHHEHIQKEHISIVKRMPGHSKSVQKHNSALPPGEKAILIACAQFTQGLMRDQLTVLTGYKRSSRDQYIQRLKTKQLIHQHQGGDRVFATNEGLKELGPDFEPLPTGLKLREYWLERLPVGEASILNCLIDNYPNEVHRDELTQVTGYIRSSRDQYIQRMKAKEIILITGPGMVKASDTLFD